MQAKQIQAIINKYQAKHKYINTFTANKQQIFNKQTNKQQTNNKQTTHTNKRKLLCWVDQQTDL